MIRCQSHKQLPLSGFGIPFDTSIDENNRWIKLSRVIPWDDFAEAYYHSLSSTESRPAKDARLVIGAVIIKHKLCLSDEETVFQSQENPYLQYFCGLMDYQQALLFHLHCLSKYANVWGKVFLRRFIKPLLMKSMRANLTQPKAKSHNGSAMMAVSSALASLMFAHHPGET